jgi:hypothetical protein
MHMALNTLYNKVTWAFIGSVALLIAFVGFYIVFVATPGFLSTVRDGLRKDARLMQRIGGEQGYELHFSEEALPEKTFFVRIDGACDSAYVRVNGTYRGPDYAITDTVLVDCE